MGDRIPTCPAPGANAPGQGCPAFPGHEFTNLTRNARLLKAKCSELRGSQLSGVCDQHVREWAAAYCSARPVEQRWAIAQCCTQYRTPRGDEEEDEEVAEPEKAIELSSQ